MLGNTGLLVSRLGFGAATFTQGNKTLPTLYKAGPEVAAELVGRAIDGGITYFDTADVYADSREDLSKPDNRFSDSTCCASTVIRRSRCSRSCRDCRSAGPQRRPGLAGLAARPPGRFEHPHGSTKMHQLEDNLGAADVALSEDEMRRLNEATAIKPLYPSSDCIVPDRRVARAIGVA